MDEDPCKSCNNDAVVVEKIEFNGNTYYYKKNEDSLLKYDFYEYNEDFGGYIPCAINNTDLYEIIKGFSLRSNPLKTLTKSDQ